MKKIISILGIAAFSILSFNVNAQCYNSPNGLWPSSTFTPNCNGSFANVTAAGYAGEYSNVNLTAGNIYVFKSSNTNDYITVDNNGAAPLVGVAGLGGVNGLSWTCTATGTYRFYTHSNSSCGSNTNLRTRSMSCTVPSSPSTNCTNSSSFGSAAINTSGLAVTISSCNYAGEYSTITGAASGQSLRFTSSAAGDYITVRSGSVGGAVVAQGVTPLQFTNTFTGTLYVHWNTGTNCGTQNSCRTTTVQCMNCTPPPAPSNDLCSGATTLACGTTTTVNTVNANTDAAGSNICGTSISTSGVWYSIAGNGQDMTVSTVGLTNTDTKIMVFSGNCSSLSCVGGSDDFSGLQSQVSWSSVSGTTYYVLAATYSGTGSFPMSLTCTTPFNPCSSISTISSCGSTQTISIPSGNGVWDNYGGAFPTPGREKIFSFTPNVSGVYPISITNSSSGWIDFFVKNASSGCNSNNWTYVGDVSGTVTGTLTLTAGVTYYFLFDDEDNSGSTGSFSISCPCIGSSVDGTYTYSAPFNITGTTVGACDDNSLRSGFDRTYAISISCAGNYTFSLCGGNTWDSYMYLTSSVGSGIITFNDDYCGSFGLSQITSSLSAGTYYVTIEGYSETDQGAFTLNISGSGAAPTITGSSTNVTCNGAANGTITASINNNGNSATTTLNGSPFNGTASNLSPGNYTIVSSNCWGSSSQNFTIVQPAALVAGSSATSIACYQGSSTVTVSATGGTAPYTGTGTFVEAAGTYSYTVTDANNCTSTTSITIDEPTRLAAFSTSGSISCNGGTTAVNVTANGGTLPYSGTGSFTVSAGSYNYTVTDANGCTETTSISVTEPSLLSASSTSGEILCNGGTTTVTVSASGGTAPYSGDGTSTVTAGNYNYTVTDANGCTASTSIVVTEPTLLVASSSSGSILCFGGSTTVTVSANGGTAPYSGTGNNTVTAGNYSYTVTDANGCTSITSINVTEPEPLKAVGAPGKIDCYGSTTDLEVNAFGGTAPYSGIGTYNVAAGTYTYVVTDANGCSTSTTVLVSQPPLIVPSVSSTPILCFGGTSTVSVTAIGGTGNLSGVGQFTEVAGSYTYTVTDDNGCSSDISINISEPTLLTASSSSGSILCNGGTTSVSVSANGGTAPYSGTGNNTVTAGNYNYTVTDANGCTASTSITVTEPSLLTASSTSTSILCNGGNSTVSVSANGGTAPYSGTGNYTVTAGNYSYTVSDANGCIATTTGTVSQPSLLTVTASSDVTVYYGYNPMACTTLSASSNNGGTGAVNFSWNNGTNGSSNTVCPSTSTVYTVTATDANGCTASDVVSVCVVNVICYAGGSNTPKVEICHNGNSICVSPDAVAAHLAHGCTLGSCAESSGCNVYARNEESNHIGTASTISLFPNPASVSLSIEFDNHESTTSTKYIITNVVGQIVAEGVIESGNNTIDISKFEGGMYFFRTFDGLNSSTMFIKE